MIGIGDDVIISGKVIKLPYGNQLDGTKYYIRLRSGDIIHVLPEDIKSYHPYQPIPETDERKGQ